MRDDWIMVLGGARCVWWDVIQLERMVGKWPGKVLAVNDIGVHWVRNLDAWCSLHSDKLLLNARERGKDLGSWVSQRQRAGHPGEPVTYSKTKKKHQAQRSVHMPHGSGSSGMLAIYVARDMHPRPRTVLCGCPMDPEPHFAESLTHQPTARWSAAKSHLKAWRDNADELRTDVRSMSGSTRRLLGFPTLDWLHG